MKNRATIFLIDDDTDDQAIGASAFVTKPPVLQELVASLTFVFGQLNKV